jgi:hypothetical protein
MSDTQNNEDKAVGRMETSVLAVLIGITTLYKMNSITNPHLIKPLFYFAMLSAAFSIHKALQAHDIHPIRAAFRAIRQK